MLSGSNIDMGGIGKAKTAVFLIIPDENTLFNKLISVFVKQCYSELLREAQRYPDNRLPVRVNFLLDEFSSLPAITDFPAMITASRSRNIRFNLFIQSDKQLYDKYGYNAEAIKGNCQNWVYLHSRELSILTEIVSLSGKKNNEENLVSVSTLQKLDKDKGEAYILNKRLYPYIATLPDISQYPDTNTDRMEIQYPVNTCKADTVFDFTYYCEHNDERYMTDESIIMEPVFNSTVPSDNEIEELSESSPSDEDNKDTEEHADKVTLEKHGSGVGQGWHGLLAPIFTEINRYNKENKDTQIQIDDIKEKYGTLRFSVRSRCPDYIEGMISIAEKESGHICEWCGARGETVEINRWLSTLCPNHAKAKKAAGADYKLASRLYRKYTDTHEREKWHSMYNPVIKKTIRKNRFVSKVTVEGTVRTIRFEREGKKTIFYAKTGKKFVKHGVYVKWVEDENNTFFDGYWNVMKWDEIERVGILERDTAEKEAAKSIYYDWGNNSHIELLRWVSLEEGQAFPQCAVQRDFYDYWSFIKKYLVKNNIKMTGAEHQKYGVPLIENNGTVYAFTLSYKKWGKLMAEAFDPDNTEKPAYLKWAGERPKGETSWVNPDMEYRGNI